MRITASQRKRNRKERRLARLREEQKGRCHWCKTPMTPRVQPARHQPFPPTMETLDHLRSKLDPTRRIPPVGYEKRWVLACWQCNQDRGAMECAALPIAELHRRAGRAPEAHQ